MPDSQLKSDLTERDRLVFDADAWRRAGYDQPDGNEQFWRRATIARLYRREDGDELADVIFHHDGRLSRGHFTAAMRPAAREALNGGEDRG